MHLKEHLDTINIGAGIQFYIENMWGVVPQNQLREVLP